MYKNKENENGFALVLSLVLLLAMSLMGGSLIVISSGDHQSNNNSDQYQQTFYVAETGLLQGEKWILDNYLGHWKTTVPDATDSLGAKPDSPPAAVAEWEADRDQYTRMTANYHKYANNYFRHSFDKGPARNNTTIKSEDKSACMKSFKNVKATDDILIAGGGSLPKTDNFINIVGPLLLNDGPYADPANENYNTDNLLENEGGRGWSTAEVEKIVEREVAYIRRFGYEFFVINVGSAAYTSEGSSIATSASNVDTQGTAYKIYSCGIFYGKGDDTEINDGNVQILIPLENLVVMPN